ncbi:GNAT family N-acetyltransferase [Actinocrispum sp. NPDC049592]|uniref:GNAT family N-acetyltransferase n=1 Tax=Actinocrispum sp. NPDC049592 TaxID=3154835 RepID=UPI0034267EDB
MPDAAELLAAYDTQMRPAEYATPEAGITVERDGPVVRMSGRYRGFISSPRDLGIDGDELDALIARQRDFFAARGEAVEWKTCGHDRPLGLTDRLRAAGFVPEDQETIVIGTAAALAVEPPPIDGVTIRQVNTDADYERIAAMESAVWGLDLSWMAADLASRRSYTTVFVAEADGEVVSAAWLAAKFGTEFAGLWGGSTLAAWRGRGIYRALVAHRALLAVDLGIRYLQVDASDDSRPILERLGFTPVTTTTPYVWSPN